MCGQGIERIVLDCRLPVGKTFSAADPVQVGGPELIVMEEPVQIGSEDPPVFCDCAVQNLQLLSGAADDMCKRLGCRSEDCLAHMDLVPLQPLRAAGSDLEARSMQFGSRLMGLLAGQHDGHDIEQPDPFGFAAFGRLDAGRVAYPAAEHLKTAADPGYIPGEAPDGRQEAVVTEKNDISDRRLAPGKDQQVKR